MKDNKVLIEALEQIFGMTHFIPSNDNAQKVLVFINDRCQKALTSYNQQEEERVYSIQEIIEFIQQEELPISIEKFFNEDGSHITKKQYGIIVINELCEVLKNKFQPKEQKESEVSDEKQIKTGEGILTYETYKSYDEYQKRIANGYCPNCNIHMSRHGTCCGEQNANPEKGTILQTPLGNGYPVITDENIANRLLSNANVETFEQYYKNEKDKFIKTVISQEWNTEMRIACESFVVMVDKLFYAYKSNKSLEELEKWCKANFFTLGRDQEYIDIKELLIKIQSLKP